MAGLVDNLAIPSCRLTTLWQVPGFLKLRWCQLDVLTGGVDVGLAKSQGRKGNEFPHVSTESESCVIEKVCS